MSLTLRTISTMRSGGSSWNPWRELRAREHVTLEWRALPRNVAGAWIPQQAGRAVIVLATWLSQRERRCALGHELVHDERGLSYDSQTPRALVEKEEIIVRRITAERFVPGLDLHDFVLARLEVEPITVDLVAEHFDVTREIALEACSRLVMEQS